MRWEHVQPKNDGVDHFRDHQRGHLLEGHGIVYSPCPLLDSTDIALDLWDMLVLGGDIKLRPGIGKLGAQGFEFTITKALLDSETA
jgi:hypothetical protein